MGLFWKDGETALTFLLPWYRIVKAEQAVQTIGIENQHPGSCGFPGAFVRSQA